MLGVAWPPRWRRGVMLPLCLAASVAFPRAGAQQEAVLEYCRQSGGCEVIRMRNDIHSARSLCAETPPSWTRPLKRLRLRITAVEQTPQQQSAPDLSYTAPSRGYCSLGLLPPSLCKDCEAKRCRMTAMTAWDSGAARAFDAILPAHSGCVHLHRLGGGVARAKAVWVDEFDPFVPLMIAAGVVLLSRWSDLRASITMHAGIGTFGGLCCVVFIGLALTWWVVREMQGALPHGRSFTGLAMALFAFIPATRQAMLSYLMPTLPSWQSLSDVLAMREPFYDLPIGWICVSVFALLVTLSVVLGARTGIAYFATPPDPDGDVPFVIGPDGRRIDILPDLPWAQSLLGFALWAAGAALLLFSTRTDAVSLAVFAAALSSGRVLHHARQLGMRLRAGAQPADLRPLMPSSSFDEQGRAFTARAVEQLQETLRSNPTLFRRVREDSELRLRRFSDGGAHMELPPDPLELEPRGWRCSVL